MRVSVAICTYNRAEGLRDTLECLRGQTYDDFEVIVVNGPSTDHTAEVIAAYEGRVRAVDNPQANLSVSRNLGIRAAAGEVVAFIDDDALPEFGWLEQALPAFSDAEVAGVGGIVFDHTGMGLQYRYSAANRFGEAQHNGAHAYDDLCRPGSFLVPYLQGTNALFRRDTLARVGLFDETFDYYLDETDVCIRLVDAGYVLRQLPDAPVHHKFLPSHVRNEHRVVTNWYPIVKNFTYFGYRHALDHASELEVIERASGFGRALASDAAIHEDAGRLPPGSRTHCENEVGRAVADGITIGRERADLRLASATLEPPVFAPFPTIDSSCRRRIVMVSSGHPPDVTGGIARYVGEVAPAMAAAGHEVRVITRGEDGGRVDLEQGVWVHRVDPGPTPPGIVADGPDYIDSFASSVVVELERMAAWTTPDIVYGPAWDVEVLGVARAVPVPVVMFLATPLDIVAEQSGLLEAPSSAHQIHGLLELERELFRTADFAHADSEAVLETITDRYGALIDPQRAGVALLGLADRVPSDPPQRDARRFLFVGRLEPRKGIDVLLAAFAAVARDHNDIELTVVGADGSPPGGDGRTYTQRFRDDHRGDPLLDRVTFTGRVDDATLETWHDWADCLVLPSRYESFGLTMLHAMVAGRAVVSSDAGSIPEVVRDGIDGLLAPPGDVGATAAAVRRIVEEPGLAAKLAESGRARFESTFTIDHSARSLMGLFDRVRLDRTSDGVELHGPTAAASVRGAPGVEVSAGGGVRFAPQPDAAPVRDALVVALEEAELVVDRGSGPEPVTLCPDRVTRVSLGSADGSARLDVRSGRIVFCGVLGVEPVPV